MSRSIKKLIPTGIVLVFMTVIFLFSGQQGESSQHLSRRIAGWIAGGLGLPAEGTAFEQINYIVRKAAHMTEYALFAGALYFSMCTWSLKRKTRIMLACIICFLYACTDEFHQLFVMGRTGQFFDVMVDTTGAALGILMFCPWLDKGVRLLRGRYNIL